MLFHRLSKHSLIDEDHVWSSMNGNTTSMIPREFSIILKLQYSFMQISLIFPECWIPPPFLFSVYFLFVLVWHHFNILIMKSYQGTLSFITSWREISVCFCLPVVCRGVCLWLGGLSVKLLVWLLSKRHRLVISQSSHHASQTVLLQM